MTFNVDKLCNHRQHLKHQSQSPSQILPAALSLAAFLGAFLMTCMSSAQTTLLQLCLAQSLLAFVQSFFLDIHILVFQDSMCYTNCTKQRFKNQRSWLAVNRIDLRLDCPLRVRHHANNISFLVTNTCNTYSGAVNFFAISKDDLIIFLKICKRLLICIVSTFSVCNRYWNFLSKISLVCKRSLVI